MGATTFEEVVVGMRTNLLATFDAEGVLGSAYRDVGEISVKQIKRLAVRHEQSMANNIALNG